MHKATAAALAFLAVGAAPAPTAARARDPLVGTYRLQEDHDAAGELRIAANGRFAYALAYGALDEHAEGRWVRAGNRICLTTLPTPVPPRFERAALGDQTATVRVTWASGRGIAGVDFRIGFAEGEPVADYTQEDGWTLPPTERRMPAWIEVAETIYHVGPARFAIGPVDRGRLHLLLVPNDIGVPNFAPACFERVGNLAVLHRAEGDMHFTRTR